MTDESKKLKEILEFYKDRTGSPGGTAKPGSPVTVNLGRKGGIVRAIAGTPIEGGREVAVVHSDDGLLAIQQPRIDEEFNIDTVINEVWEELEDDKKPNTKSLEVTLLFRSSPESLDYPEQDAPADRCNFEDTFILLPTLEFITLFRDTFIGEIETEYSMVRSSLDLATSEKEEENYIYLMGTDPVESILGDSLARTGEISRIPVNTETFPEDAVNLIGDNLRAKFKGSKEKLCVLKVDTEDLLFFFKSKRFYLLSYYLEKCINAIFKNPDNPITLSLCSLEESLGTVDSESGNITSSVSYIDIESAIVHSHTLETENISYTVEDGVLDINFNVADLHWPTGEDESGEDESGEDESGEDELGESINAINAILILSGVGESASIFWAANTNPLVKFNVTDLKISIGVTTDLPNG